MPRFFSLLVFSLAVSVIFSACARKPLEDSIKLTEQDRGCIVRMNIGGRLDLVLAANPTTGYAWEAAAADSAVIREVGKEEFKPDSKAIGAGGRITLHFEAAASGRTGLKLVYRRPWENNIAPLDSFEITVAVRDRLKKIKE